MVMLQRKTVRRLLAAAADSEKMEEATELVQLMINVAKGNCQPANRISLKLIQAQDANSRKALKYSRGQGLDDAATAGRLYIAARLALLLTQLGMLGCMPCACSSSETERSTSGIRSTLKCWIYKSGDYRF